MISLHYMMLMLCTYILKCLLLLSAAHYGKIGNERNLFPTSIYTTHKPALHMVIAIKPSESVLCEWQHC